MTMQNPDKPILAKDLNDYHNKILPYLGGMPEVLANKFAKGDLYDTNEKIIGKWIDGKPLYQKVIQFTNNAGSYLIDVSSLNVDSIWLDGIYINNSGEYNTIGVYYYSSSDFLRVLISDNKQSLLISAGSSFSIGSGFCIIKFTKSTDSANSFNISSDTDYSTEEKIVGTWIDGSYIYQKTIKITVPNGTSSTTFASNVDKSYIMNAILNTVNNECIPLPVFGNYTIRMYTQGSLLYLENNHPNWIGSDLYVTIQYTKTT